VTITGFTIYRKRYKTPLRQKNPRL